MLHFRFERVCLSWIRGITDWKPRSQLKLKCEAMSCSFWSMDLNAAMTPTSSSARKTENDHRQDLHWHRYVRQSFSRVSTTPFLPLENSINSGFCFSQWTRRMSAWWKALELEPFYCPKWTEDISTKVVLPWSTWAMMAMFLNAVMLMVAKKRCKGSAFPNRK